MKRACLCVWLGACLWLLGACRAGAALTPDDQLQLADSLYARGIYDLGIREYLGFVDAYPDDKRLDMVLFRVAESYNRMGNRIAAEKYYKRVYTDFAASPYHFRAGLGQASLFMDGQHYDAALMLLQDLAGEHPPAETAAACTYMSGQALMKLGRRDEAVRMFERVRVEYSGSPFYAHALMELADVAAAKPETTGSAVEWYRTAATNAAVPRVAAEAWFQLGQVLYRSSRFEESAQAFEKLMSFYPADARVDEARMPLAWALHYSGRYADALAYCQKALQPGTNGAPRQAADWLYLKANCERQLVNNAQAIQTYGQLLATYPQSPLADAAAYEKALAYYKMGGYSQAVAQARGLELTPRIKKDVYWLIAESSAALNDRDTAVQYYRMLTEQYPGDPLQCDALYRLGFLLQERGELAEASAIFVRLSGQCKDSPLAPQALLASGYCLSRLGRHTEAIRDWALLIDTYPQSTLIEEALYQKAMSEAYVRRDAQALETLQALMKRFPNSRYAADACFWSGAIQAEAGRLPEAEAQLTRVLELKPGDELQLRTRFRLGLVYQQQGRLNEAAAQLEGLINSAYRAKFPAELLQWLSEYQLGRKEYAKGLEAARLIVERFADTSWQQTGWCLAGRGLEGLGSRSEAQAAYEKSLGLGVETPAAAEAALRLGDLALGAGDTSVARGYFEKAAALSSSDTLLGIRARAYAGIARALKQQGDMEGAAKYFLSVAVLFDGPDLVPECLYEASEALNRLGRSEDSRKAARELRERYPDSTWAGKVNP